MTFIVGISSGVMVDTATVWRDLPGILEVLQEKEYLNGYFTPTVLYTLYLWNQMNYPESNSMTWLYLQRKMSYEKSCGNTISPICTPHMWKNGEHLQLFPSLLQGNYFVMVLVLFFTFL